jgi:hypothetical protein
MKKTDMVFGKELFSFRAAFGNHEDWVLQVFGVALVGDPAYNPHYV